MTICSVTDFFGCTSCMLSVPDGTWMRTGLTTKLYWIFAQKTSIESSFHSHKRATVHKDKQLIKNEQILTLRRKDSHRCNQESTISFLVINVVAIAPQTGNTRFKMEISNQVSGVSSKLSPFDQRLKKN